MPIPEKYAHVNEWVRDAEARLRQLDDEPTAGDEGLNLRHNPPGTGFQPVPPPRRTKDQVQQEKDNLKAEVLQRAEKETAEADKSVRNQVVDTVFLAVYREDIEAYERAANALADPSKDLDINQAQFIGQYKMVQTRLPPPERARERRPIERDFADDFMQQFDLDEFNAPGDVRDPEKEDADDPDFEH